MRKLLKYIKPFTVSLVFIISLLFIQATFELTLPDYMSNIVNTGISTGGIEDGVPNAIRYNEYNKVSLFMNDDEKNTFNQHYQLYSASDNNKDLLEKYPVLKDENIYVLKDINRKEKAELKKALGTAELCVSGIRQQAADSNSTLMKDMPAGTDPFAMLFNAGSEQIAKVKEEVNKQSEALGDSNMETSRAMYVKEEYQAMGMNVKNIQFAYLFTYGGLMLALSFGSAICAILVGFLASKVAAGVAHRMRNDIFTKVESFSSVEFNHFSTSTLITRTTNDIQQIQLVLVLFLRMVLYAPIIGIGAMIKVINSNASMTWIIALVVVVIITLMLSVFTIVMPKFKRIQKLTDKLNSVLREFLDGLSVIRAFNTQKHEEAKFEKANDDITKTNLFVNRVMACLFPLMMLIMNLVTIAIIWVGGHQIDIGNLMVGDMLAFMQYSMQIIMAFLMITMIFVMLPRAVTSFQRVKEVLDTPLSIKDTQDAKNLGRDVKGHIIFDHVSFRYPGAEEDVLHDISFEAKPGETTAFIGSTGSGKSTIINLVPRFFDVSGGQILIDGVDIRDVKQHDLREKIGYVPQKANLFSGTIATNLRYAKEDASEEQLQLAAEIAQASEFILSKEEGFDASIAQGGSNVSGGQKQRLSIARALTKEAEVYIFDDTFSALDFKTDAKLRKALGVLCKDTQATVLLVAQRISSIMHAENIVVLDKGRIVGIGKHEQLLKNCDVYQEIAYSQLSKEELAHE